MKNQNLYLIGGALLAYFLFFKPSVAAPPPDPNANLDLGGSNFGITNFGPQGSTPWT